MQMRYRLAAIFSGVRDHAKPGIRDFFRGGHFLDTTMNLGQNRVIFILQNEDTLNMLFWNNENVDRCLRV